MSIQNANPVALEETMSSAPSEEQHPPHRAETGEVTGERSLDAIKEEILLHKGQTEQSFIEMGKLLTVHCIVSCILYGCYHTHYIER